MKLFTEAQLCDFGNYLLKTYNVQVHSNSGSNSALHQRDVSHADLTEWDSKQKHENYLPAAHQIGESVWLCLWSHVISGEINAIHFTESKVKYDLNVFEQGGGQTRLYNIDSAFVTKCHPQQIEK